MWKEFKEFVSRGSVIDLAVGIIIGTAFGAIVKSLVEDIIMPPIGMVLGNIDFKDLFVALNGKAYASLAAAKEAGAPVIAYGNFINQVINFIILAFVIFLLIKQINRLQRAPKTAPAAPTTKECPYCKTSIPISAVRCPNCTSQLDGSPALKEPARGRG